MDQITGRDGYIIAKALAYAIEAIAQLPVERREQGDRDDMIAILDWMVDSDIGLADVIGDAHSHLTGDGHASTIRRNPSA